MNLSQISRIGCVLAACVALFSASLVQAAPQDEVFYFVIPDRFSNGDPSNDTGGIEGDRYQHGFDQTDARFFHGGDLKGLTNNLRYIKRQGVTAIWISPPFKNKPVAGESAAYHGYWALDYTQVDPHWGTNAELKAFIKKAHQYRMKVFFDVVINHTADVIRYAECHNPDGSLQDGLSNCPYRSTEESESNPYTPFIPEGEENSKVPAWLNDPAYYHNQGDSTFAGESSLKGDFFGLDDLATEHPAVIDGMTNLAKGWIDEFDIDGMRVDTVKHVDDVLWKQWVPQVKAHAQAAGKADFFFFGEVFDGLPANTARYTRDLGFPSVLDFALYYAIKDVLTDYQGTDRLAWVFSQDDQYTSAHSNANNLMTFVSNHDVGRIGHFIDSMTGISEEEKLARLELAYSMLFYMRGAPVIYYGDEQGFTGDGGDAEAREDMFPSAVAAYNDNNLIGTDATTADNNFDVRHPLLQHIQSLNLSQRVYSELRDGVQFVRQSEQSPGILALSRFNPDKRREALVIFNTSTETRAVSLPVMARQYSPALPGIGGKTVAAQQGMLTVEVEPLSTTVYVSRGKLSFPENLPDISISSLTEGEKVSGIVNIAAALSGASNEALPLHRVHFDVSIDGAPFQPLGTDSNPDYQVFFNVTELADGTQLRFRARVDNYAAASNSAEIQVEVGVEPGMRIIFKKPEDWAAPNIYWWNAFPQAGTDWPGVAMTQLIDDWYEFRFDDGVGQANLIFNDGSNQTADLYREGDGCYIDMAWQDTCEVPEPGMAVYFRKPEGWGDAINVFWWNADPQPGVDWPGQPMEVIGEGWYRFQFDNNVAAANLIFNDGNGNQTADLYREGDGCFEVDAWLSDCEPPVAGIKLYFKRPASWGEDINIYYWNADPALGVDWPGISMFNEGNDWYSYQFPLNVTAANLIFNDGSGNQTTDLYRAADGCYVNDGWQDSCEIGAPEPGMTVYFRRPLDWNVPNVHYWYEGGGSAWPGEEMDALGDDWYKLQLPEGVTAANMVINDKTDGANGHQTGDLYREGDGCYDLASDSWSDSCATPGYTAYFKKPDTWSTAYAYFWNTSPSVVDNVGWPGEAMDNLGNSWFSYQLPNGVMASNIIFNNAGAPQTADLYREGDGCYTLDGGWTDSCELPTPGMTVYFYKPDGWADSINIYFWNVDNAPGWPGTPMQSLGEGWFSYTFAQGVDEANLIFNDGSGNQTADLMRSGGGCFGEFGDFWRKSCIVPTDIEVEISGRAAHWLDSDSLAWQVTDNRASQYRLYYSASASLAISGSTITGEDGFIDMTATGGLDADLQAQNPHLASWPAYQLNDTDDLANVVKAQLVVAAMDSNGSLLQATRVQHARALDALFPYDGELGVQYAGDTPSITVWAPTAQSIELVLYDNDLNEVSRHLPDAIEAGAYTFNGEPGWDKLHYRFAMTVYHPLTDALETYEVTDPYSIGLSANSQYSQIVDIAADNSLKPAGWDAVQKALPAHQDITLYEGHLRDFSQQDSSVPEAHRGTYKAFTYNGVDGAALSAGMAHLSNLSQAGLTHFHLLPVFDISSINEDPAARVDVNDPFSRLCAMSSAPAVQDHCDSAGDTPIIEVLTELKLGDAANADIQAIVAAMVNQDSFNWGYDPYHFNAPEGSYATSADGVTRILEFREMVQALDEIGLNVVMDVVYNHTSASGLWDNSVLDKVVPGYYHRLNPTSGGVENSTCCDNTATEHRMMEKLMVDTLVSWAKYFKIDSFRFDLMGHIPKSGMQKAQQALAALTLTNDGVDGANIYLYGEGWNFGEVANDARFEQATQFNMAGTGIGTFNDRIRSAIRGGNFTDSGRAQGWTSGNELFPNGYASGGSLNDQADRIRIGLAGNLQDYPFVDNSGFSNTGLGYAGVGYTLDPQESVNYVDKHDNETLWDNTQAKLPDSMGADDRVRVHMLSNALINYGQGVPFYQMGTDLLRSKSMDRNSYNSGDWFNAVDFSATDNQWASGLPLAQDNETRWASMADILYNGNISVTPAQIATAHATFTDQLAIRYSSPLFRLQNAEDVIQRVGFNNTGASQMAGIIAMSLSDGTCAGNDLDPDYDGILVLFNADDAAQSVSLPGFDGHSLHPRQVSGNDEVVKSTIIDGETFTIPAHTAAVLVKPQAGAQGDYPCNPQADDNNLPGFTVYFQKPDGWGDINVYYWNTSPASASVNWPGDAMQAIGDNWYSYTFPNGVQAANLILNDGAGNQTADLYREGDGCFAFADGFWTDSCQLPGLTFYFRKAAHWSDDIHIHYWNAGDVPGTSWPGEAMSLLGDGWFMFQMPDGVRATNLIFNDAASGTGEQTSDLFRNQDGCFVYDDGFWTASCTLP